MSKCFQGQSVTLSIISLGCLFSMAGGTLQALSEVPPCPAVLIMKPRSVWRRMELGKERGEPDNPQKARIADIAKATETLKET